LFGLFHHEKRKIEKRALLVVELFFLQLSIFVEVETTVLARNGVGDALYAKATTLKLFLGE
jgi:hypothetical protein